MAITRCWRAIWPWARPSSPLLKWACVAFLTQSYSNLRCSRSCAQALPCLLLPPPVRPAKPDSIPLLDIKRIFGELRAATELTRQVLPIREAFCPKGGWGAN